MAYKNKEDQLECQRKWYERNKNKVKNNSIKRKREIRRWLTGYKSNLKCEKCPESDSRCLDFHHIKGKKEKCVSIMVRDGYSIRRISEEIKKCKVLCANCHRKETLNR